ncbi:Cof-type HAD-IIB family hydrolase [Ochrovirga pacifica]|uniref:Cof-type HAD-IIB family hydrolase n=1 Tax=Ochrovirga pacifica TaxID=1042376 RepID=UPI0002558AC4|nr:Cof-type HAD-IIB family hydrolase [Ochrovirga pacifica]
MDLSNVKLVVSDMDGTLLNSNHEVSELFFKQFHQLKEKNIQFVAASGRQYHSIVQKLAPVKKDLIVVAENGAFVVAHEQLMYVNAFDSKDIRYFLNIVADIPSTYAVLAGKDRAYFLKGNKELETIVSEYYSEYQLLDSFDELPKDELLKIALYNQENSEKNIYPYLKHLSKDWQIKVSGVCWLDIALPSNHKGNAIEKIQEQLGIGSEETLVFGDYMNDVEMLKKAKFSVAMQNAHPEVKKIARYETTSNDENGVEKIIEKLIAQI